MKKGCARDRIGSALRSQRRADPAKCGAAVTPTAPAAAGAPTSPEPRRRRPPSRTSLGV